MKFSNQPRHFKPSVGRQWGQDHAFNSSDDESCSNRSISNPIQNAMASDEDWSNDNHGKGFTQVTRTIQSGGRVEVYSPLEETNFSPASPYPPSTLEPPGSPVSQTSSRQVSQVGQSSNRWVRDYNHGAPTTPASEYLAALSQRFSTETKKAATATYIASLPASLRQAAPEKSLKKRSDGRTAPTQSPPTSQPILRQGKSLQSQAAQSRPTSRTGAAGNIEVIDLITDDESHSNDSFNLTLADIRNAAKILEAKKIKQKERSALRKKRLENEKKEQEAKLKKKEKLRRRNNQKRIERLQKRNASKEREARDKRRTKVLGGRYSASEFEIFITEVEEMLVKIGWFDEVRSDISEIRIHHPMRPFKFFEGLYAIAYAEISEGRMTREEVILQFKQLVRSGSLALTLVEEDLIS